MVLRGALEEAARWRGTWSEVSLEEEIRVVSGRAKLQEELTRTLSSLARMGVFCWLDQVNCRSNRGISISPKLLIRLLKEVASVKLKLSLDLSLGVRMRLKSPKKATWVDKEPKIVSREDKKDGLLAWAQGP
jgi:hypothetical protein